jgi:predicted transcriptional regulator
MGLSSKEYYVKDLVIDDQYSIIEAKATIEDAAKKMKEFGIPDLVVVEEGSEKVLGVIGDFDIVQNVIAEGLDPKSTTVVSAMYKISPVSLDSTVKEAFTRMQKLQVNIIPVLENDKLIGVCSIQDCWSYIPDQIVDEIGLIPVTNTKVAEFWFGSVSSIIAILLGIILPLAGVYGFFLAEQADVMYFLGLADVRGGTMIFYLFEAHGYDFFIPIINLASKGGAIWITIGVFSILLLIIGFIGLFALIYASFADVRNIHTSNLIRLLLPSLIVVFMVLEWILLGIALATASPTINYSVDPIGLTLSIISMVLIIAAINRDYLFRQKSSDRAELNEVK